MKTKKKIQIVGLILCLGWQCVTKADSVYDVALDFSISSNPNGVWTYGYTTTLGGTIILYTENGNFSGLDFWRNNLYLGAPVVAHNSTSSTLDFGTPVYGPGQVGLHPGPGGEYSVCRFTAPRTGLYDLKASFFGIDKVGTTTDIHILFNDVSIFDSTVNGFGPGTGPSFNSDLILSSDDRIDFVVGFGNGNFYSDSTGIEVNLKLLPGCGDGTLPYPQGDLSQNCCVDLVDFSLFAAQWQSSSCAVWNNWCGGADLNHDHLVNLDEFVMLANNWLLCNEL